MSPPAAATRRRVPVAWLARFAISALVLLVLFYWIPVGDVWAQAQRLAPAVWVGALLVFLAGHAAAAAKWRLLIGHGVSFTHAFQAHLGGLAANLCLPGLASGDVVRAGLVFNEAQDRSRLVIGSIADRLLDMLGLLIFAALGAVLVWRPEYAQHGMFTWFLAASVIGVLALLAAFALLSRLANRLVQPMSGTRGIRGAIVRAIGVAAALSHEPGRLLLCLGISMLVQATFIVINIVFATELDVTAPWAAWFFAWSSAKIVAVAPVSLGGLGVREAALAQLLAPFGADPSQVIAIGLVWQTVLYASGLLGALALLVWKPARAPAGRVLAADRAERAP
ncbi:MAG: lysylphosphatidylglycerol synthase transmembrane domain-containing protein [Casimicrobiaceae bacterium]